MRVAGSIHFSLIAGRILFKNIRYYSSSQTIRIVKGQMQWRYWIRAPMDEIDFQTQAAAGTFFTPPLCLLRS